jgi:hypothetical protein
LKANLRKFELVEVEEVPHQEKLADILNCSISSLPMKYLGLPMGVSFKSRAIWDGIVERTEKVLASWKKIYLSWGGQLTLIKSTLFSVPLCKESRIFVQIFYMDVTIKTW